MGADLRLLIEQIHIYLLWNIEQIHVY